jgi:acyl-CoA thioesterase-2
LVAYASDLTPVETALAGAGLDPHGRDAPATTTNHSLWFHHNPDARQWSLNEQHCTEVSDGRALVHGSLTDAAGRLITTFAQELALYANTSSLKNPIISAA